MASEVRNQSLHIQFIEAVERGDVNTTEKFCRADAETRKLFESYLQTAIVCLIVQEDVVVSPPKKAHVIRMLDRTFPEGNCRLCSDEVVEALEETIRRESAEVGEALKAFFLLDQREEGDLRERNKSS